MLMLNIYHWAYVNPVKKLFFNLVVTVLSVLMALFISIIQLLTIAKNSWELKGPFWDLVEEISENFGLIGAIITGMFVLTWFVSYIIYKFGGYKSLEDQMKIDIIA